MAITALPTSVSTVSTGYLQQQKTVLQKKVGDEEDCQTTPQQTKQKDIQAFQAKITVLDAQIQANQNKAKQQDGTTNPGQLLDVTA